MWNVSATAAPEQIDRWHKYALASFLLGTNGHSYFNFSTANTVAGVFIDHPWDRVQVGGPVNRYAKVRGVYRRDFSAGIALVNPTTASVTLSLGGTYRDLSGVERTSITLTPNTGDVLVKP